MDRISTALLAQVSKNLPDPEEVPYSTIFMPIRTSETWSEMSGMDRLKFDYMTIKRDRDIASYWEFDGTVFASDEVLHYPG